MMWNSTLPEERQLYQMAMETLMEVSEPTTVQDFNTYKQLFEQKFPARTRTHSEPAKADAGCLGIHLFH
jgi:hypothetical protein